MARDRSCVLTHLSVPKAVTQGRLEPLVVCPLLNLPASSVLATQLASFRPFLPPLPQPIQPASPVALTGPMATQTAPAHDDMGRMQTTCICICADSMCLDNRHDMCRH